MHSPGIGDGPPPFTRFGRRPSVWVAEDDEPLRFCLTRLLELDGLAVEEFGSGVELMAKIDHAAGGFGGAGLPDLLITDVRMPGCTGVDVLALMQDVLRDTPCVVISAFGDPAVRERVERLKATFLDKPVDLDPMSRSVARALRDGAASRGVS